MHVTKHCSITLCLPDGFASDPFKGSDPFAAEVLFPKLSVATDERTANAGDEADTSLSCAENKASTGTQCFEAEFPDEDSDIEISYSQEDLENIAVADESCGFKPIESSSEELGADQIWQWRSRGQYSTESDPNGYELDLGAVSPPSDIEEHTLGSLDEETNMEQMEGTEQGNLYCHFSFSFPLIFQSFCFLFTLSLQLMFHTCLINILLMVTVSERKRKRRY